MVTMTCSLNVCIAVQQYVWSAPPENIEQLASILQTILYVHRRRFAKCRDMTSGSKCLQSNMNSIAHAMLMLRSACNEDSNGYIPILDMTWSEDMPLGDSVAFQRHVVDSFKSTPCFPKLLSSRWRPCHSLPRLELAFPS